MYRYNTRARLAMAAIGAVALAGCGGPDLGSTGRSSAFDSGLSGNYSGYGGGGGNLRTGQPGSGLRGRGTYSKLEASFELGDVKGNPFDYTENDVIVTITRPDNQTVKVPAFFDGGPNNKTWRVRYTPDMTGRHALTKVTLNGHDVQPEKFDKREFDVSGSAQPGFIHRDMKDRSRFAFDNGNSYYPLGHDVAWESKPEDYARTFEKMEKAGENWSRIWMTHWDGKNLDWTMQKKTDPGKIDLEVARRWDQILDAAEKNGIYFQMVLQHHGQYSSRTDPNWGENPWNKTNGGWLSSPDEFFSNSRAVALTRVKYRYIVARYGYSPNILAFELFNEVEGTDAVFHKHQNEVLAWHNEMADFLHKQDPFHHLVTSSSGMDPTTLGRDLDYWQLHAYPSDPVSTLAAVDTRRLDRPVFFGEIGPSGALDRDDGAWLHRALWASLMSDMGGAAQYWAWDTVEKNDLYGQFKAASDFLKQSGLISRRGLLPTAPAIETTERAALSVSPGAGWGATKQTEFTVLPSGAVEGIGAMPAYLQGSAHREMFPSATFKTTYAEPGTFAVTVGAVARAGANLTILVDGSPAAEKTFKSAEKDTTADATVETKIAAGAHTIRIENSGADWLTIRRITLAPYAPALGAVGKAGKDYAAFWVYNRQPVRSDAGVKGKLTVPGLASGSYKVAWWDPTTGKTVSEETASADKSGLTVPTPTVPHDLAVTVMRSGEKVAAKSAGAKKAKGL